MNLKTRLTTKQEWCEAWRIGRIIHKSQPANTTALCHLKGVLYLAWWTAYRRDETWHLDQFNSTPKERLECKKIVDEIIQEILAEDLECPSEDSQQ